jgi:peptidyl-prolyl cis-trans isomerase C
VLGGAANARRRAARRDHDLVGGVIDSVIAKADRLRDKSRPSADQRRTATTGPAMTAHPDIRPASTQAPAPRRRARTLGLVAAALMLTLPVGSARAQDDPLIAKVDGVEIRQSDLTLAEEDMGQNAQMLAGDAKRDYLVAYIADVILVARAAEAGRVADQKEFKTRIAFIRSKLLMEILLQAQGKAAVTDQAMRTVYDEAAKQMAGEQEVRARHILVATENEAHVILAEIRKGTDFAELAKQRSKDPGAAAKGGDLGYFAKQQMVPEFAEVAFKLEKGKVSEPVKTQFGWHIIKVEDKRGKPVPEFDKVKEQIETFVMRKAQGEYIAKLRAGAKIERMDKK